MISAFMSRRSKCKMQGETYVEMACDTDLSSVMLNVFWTVNSATLRCCSTCDAYRCNDYMICAGGKLFVTCIIVACDIVGFLIEDSLIVPAYKKN
jgi:hypothetical protein